MVHLTFLLLTNIHAIRFQFPFCDSFIFHSFQIFLETLSDCYSLNFLYFILCFSLDSFPSFLLVRVKNRDIQLGARLQFQRSSSWMFKLALQLSFFLFFCLYNSVLSSLNQISSIQVVRNKDCQFFSDQFVFIWLSDAFRLNALLLRELLRWVRLLIYLVQGFAQVFVLLFWRTFLLLIAYWKTDDYSFAACICHWSLLKRRPNPLTLSDAEVT